MSLSSITPMPRILSPTISIVGYKYEHPFQPLVDDLINYKKINNPGIVVLLKSSDEHEKG